MNRNRFEVFDIIGPIMIGPSSSHTAGAVRIGLVAGQLCGYEPEEVTVLFHGAFSSTYSVHKTDVAVVAGTMGIDVDDERIKNAIEIAESKGIKVRIDTVELGENAHPSTIVIKLKDGNGKEQVLRAATIGGGNIVVEEINGYGVHLDGKQDCLVGLTGLEDGKAFESLVKDKLEKEMKVVKFAASGKLHAFRVENGKHIEKHAFEKLKSLREVEEVFFLKAVMPLGTEDMNFYRSCKELVEESQRNKCLISDTVIKFEADKSGRGREQVVLQMREAYFAMKDSIQKGLEKENEPLGNIFKGNSAKMDRFLKSGGSVCGGALSRVVRNALAVMEVNSSMGRIVACPTAGSSGTVPAAVVTVAETNGISEEKVIQSLFTGAGIGIIIAENASISGVVGGCQGECGSASAMAAAVITEMFGGDYFQILSAVSLAFGNILGMICDPVAGLIEIPCIQRNTLSAVNAIISAEMALAGVDSVIPADEMIGALDEVGKLMPCALKGTLKAGMANTPTARKIEAEIFGKNR